MNWLLTRNLIAKKILSIRIHFVQTNCVYLLLWYRFINVLITNKIGTQVTFDLMILFFTFFLQWFRILLYVVASEWHLKWGKRIMTKSTRKWFGFFPIFFTLFVSRTICQSWLLRIIIIIRTIIFLWTFLIEPMLFPNCMNFLYQWHNWKEKLWNKSLLKAFFTVKTKKCIFSVFVC